MWHCPCQSRRFLARESRLGCLQRGMGSLTDRDAGSDGDGHHHDDESGGDGDDEHDEHGEHDEHDEHDEHCEHAEHDQP